MSKRICRINGTYDFPFEFMSERASYNQATRSYEPVLRFQASLGEKNTFVLDLIPYMGQPITSIEIFDSETNESFTMPEAYDTIVDVSTNFPQVGEHSGQIIFSNSAYANLPVPDFSGDGDDTEPKFEYVEPTYVEEN